MLQLDCVAECGSGTVWLSVAVGLWLNVAVGLHGSQCGSWTVWLNVAVGLCG